MSELRAAPAVRPPATAPHRRAVLMLLVANLFWGLSFPLIKSIEAIQHLVVPDGSTWFITAGALAPRFLLATLLLGAIMQRRVGACTRRELEQGVLIAITSGAGMLLQNDGLQFTPASVSAFLTQFYAIMIPVWVALRMKRRPRAVVVVCAALVLAGVALLGRFDFHHLRLGRGEIETLAGSVFFMMQILLLERQTYAANRAQPVTLVMFVGQGMLFSVMAAATAPRWGALFTPWTSLAWLALTGGLTLFCTLGCYLLMNTWQPEITATEAGLIYCVEPVFASAFALFLPAVISGWAGFHYDNEQLTWHLLIGGGLVTLANVLIQLQPPPKTQARPPG